jgi:pheromone shutdown-related protein TraB
MSENEAGKNWVTINKNGKEITILGTAHVLSDSKKEVEELIDSLNPDTVCVELCDSRYQSLQDKNRWKNLDIVKVIRDGKGFLLLANMVLSSFQKRVGADLESAPGDEMITAFKTAEEKGKKVVLADRDINVTLRRAWGYSSFGDKMKIFEMLFESLFVKEEINKKDIKELMEGKDMMTEVMNTFAENLPKAKEVLIDERDQFLANKIKNSGGTKILAVVGKGHQKGIISTIENDTPYNPGIEQIPPKGKFGKIFPWAFGALIIAIIVYGFLKGSSVGLSMLWAWVIASGSVTSLFALLVLSHPLTILAAWIAAPIKLFAPTISAGMIMAPVEAMMRKPQVKDFEKLNDDIMTFKGFIKNRVTRILIVFAASTIGAIIGHTWAFVWIAKILATH